jgi:hypothetical protein
MGGRHTGGVTDWSAAALSHAKIRLGLLPGSLVC